MSKRPKVGPFSIPAAGLFSKHYRDFELAGELARRVLLQCNVCRTAMNDVTRILSAIEAGTPQAADELLPLVYNELRKLAGARLAREAGADASSYRAGSRSVRTARWQRKSAGLE